MRILVLTQWYPPEPANMVEQLAQGFKQQGSHVSVLTGFPNYPTGKLYPGYRLKWRMQENLNGIEVTRSYLYPDHSLSKIKRIANYLSFSLSSAIVGLLCISRPDIIFVYHPPLTVAIPAIFLSKLWRVPFVYQIQDMWPETLTATGMLGNQRLIKWIGLFARWVYERASLILVISPGFRNNLIEKGVPDGKIRVIPNGVDTNLYFPATVDNELAKTLGLAGKFNVMYAGNMGRAQALDSILEAAALLRDQSEIQFVLVGNGVDLPYLEAIAKKRALKNVRFLGRFSPGEMSKLYALANILLAHLRDEPLFRITIPHKIQTYFAVGKPVIAALEGDGADVVRQAGAGIVCPPQNPTKLAETILGLYSLAEEDRREMGKRGLHAAETQYSVPSVVSQIHLVLQQTVSNPNEVT